MKTTGSNSKLWVLYSALFIDQLSVGLVIPLLPYYSQLLGAGPSLFGLLETTYGVFQLIGSPFMGRLSDKYGRKNILCISFIGCIFSYFLTAIAPSFFILFLARIPIGLVKQTISVSYAYISDATHGEKGKTQHLGVVETMSSVGFIIGPSLGGLLSTVNVSLPAFVACGLFFGDLLFVFFLLPNQIQIPNTAAKDSKGKVKTDSEFETENVPHSNQNENTPHHKNQFIHSIQSTITKLKLGSPYLFPLMLIHVVFALASSTFRSSFVIFTQRKYSLLPKTTGLLMSYIGILSVFTQTFVITFFVKRLEETQVVLVAPIILAISYVSLTFTSSTWGLLIALSPTVISSGLMRTCVLSLIMDQIPKAESGKILGLVSSVESIARVICPALAGLLLNYSISAALVFSSTICTILSTVIYYNYNFITEIHTKTNVQTLTSPAPS